MQITKTPTFGNKPNEIRGQGPIGEGPMKTLVGSLRAKDVFARVDAAFSLGKMRDRGAVPALIGALNDPEPMVRRSVIDALGEIGDNFATPHLKRVVESDPSVPVKEAAKKALARCGGK